MTEKQLQPAHIDAVIITESIRVLRAESDDQWWLYDDDSSIGFVPHMTAMVLGDRDCAIYDQWPAIVDQGDHAKRVGSDLFLMYQSARRSDLFASEVAAVSRRTLDVAGGIFAAVVERTESVIRKNAELIRSRAAIKEADHDAAA